MWCPLGRALGSATADGPSGSFDRGSFSMRWSEKDGGRRSQITSNSPNLGASIRSKPKTYENRRKEEAEEGGVGEHGGTNRFEWVVVSNANLTFSDHLNSFGVPLIISLSAQGSIAISIEFRFQLFYGQSLTFTVALSLSSLKPFALSLDSTTVRPFLVASDRGVLASASRRVGLGRIPTAPPFSVLVAYIIKKGRIPTAPTPLIENLAVHLLDGVSSSRCRLQEGRASAASL
ncbi:hypothetical protein BHM03_00039914 [Ensete ventricosum]|nr:hypothetical protein BHM03_00039914 [Ensete ventricosum]